MSRVVYIQSASYEAQWKMSIESLKALGSLSLQLQTDFWTKVEWSNENKSDLLKQFLDCSYLALNEWQNFAVVSMNNGNIALSLRVIGLNDFWTLAAERNLQSAIMTTNLSHPYKDHPEAWKIPAERENEIEELYQWFDVEDKSFQVRWTIHSISGWSNNRGFQQWRETTSINSITLAFTTKRRRKKHSSDMLKWELSLSILKTFTLYSIFNLTASSISSRLLRCPRPASDRNAIHL